MISSKISLILWTRRFLCLLIALSAALFCYFKYPTLQHGEMALKFFFFLTALFSMVYAAVYLILTYFVINILEIHETVESDFYQLSSMIVIKEHKNKKVACFTMTNPQNIVDIMIEVQQGKVGSRNLEHTFENIKLKPKTFYNINFFKRQYLYKKEKQDYYVVPIGIGVWDFNLEENFLKFDIKPNKKYRPSLHIVKEVDELNS